MIGVQTAEAFNSANVPDFVLPPPSLESYFAAPLGNFFGNACAIPQGAKLENIPYILRVLLLVFERLGALSARPGLV